MVTPRPGVIKIGYTINGVERRRRRLEKMNGLHTYLEPFTIVASWPTPSAWSLEKQFQRKMLTKRCAGLDYFKMDLETALRATDEMVALSIFFRGGREAWYRRYKPLNMIMRHILLTDQDRYWRSYYDWHLHYRKGAVLPLPGACRAPLRPGWRPGDRIRRAWRLPHLG